MSSTLKFEIVTPEGVRQSADADWVVLPGVQGELGIFPNHEPLLTRIVPGELSVHANGQTTYAAVGDGFAEITGEHVHVMADMMVAAESIDEAQAEHARQKAQDRLKEKLTDEEFASAQASLVRASTQLEVRRRSRR